METEIVRTNGALQSTQGASDQAVESVQIPPPVDIYEGDSELLLLADMPGVASDALELTLDPPELWIRGRTYVGDVPVEYRRAFRVDPRVDPDGIEATLDSGVLTLRMKKLEAFKPKAIPVRTS